MKLLVPSLLSALMVLHVQAAHEGNARWDSRFALPGVDGSVFSMAFNHRQIFLGGYINSIGRATNDSGVAMFDGKRWKSLRRGPAQNPPEIGVIGVETFRNRLYACGYFTNVSGLPSCGFARWNGQRWSNPAGTNGMVLFLESTANGLLVCGQFQLPGVSNLVSLARYNGRRWTVLMESTPVSDDTHLSTVQQCEQLESGEIIATDGGRVLHYVDAQWSPLLTPNGSPQGFGSYVLTKFHGDLIAVSSQAVYSWSGHAWQKLGDDFDEALGAAGNDRKLFAVHRVGPAVYPRQYAVSQWNGTNWQRFGTNLFPADYARVFVGPQDRPYVTGTFPGFPPVVAAALIRWNGTRWEPLFHGTYEGVNGSINSVLAFAQHSGDVFMGGLFLTAGKAFGNCVARWDGRHWQEVGSGFPVNRGENVRALASDGGLLYAAGRFTNISGISASNVAAWNGTNWLALGPGLANKALALAKWNGSVVVGGEFEQAGGVTAHHVAQWNGTNWQTLGEGCNGDVGALTSWRGELYAAGSFTRAGGSAASLIARWNGSEWREVGGGLVSDTEDESLFGLKVNALTASEDCLYVAGQFQKAGTIAATNIARWDGTNWHSLELRFTDPDDAVHALLIRDHLLYVGGIWRDSTGKRVALLQRWNGANWTSLGSGVSNPYPNLGRVYALLGTDEEVFVGGRFTWAGGKPSANVARWIEKLPSRH